MNTKLFFKVFSSIVGIALIIFIISGIAYTTFFSSKNVNILFLATDKGKLLTDTVMVANINSDTKKINLLSLPRDTRVVLGNGSHDKLNSIYQRDKKEDRPALVVKIVEEMLDIPLDHYVVMHPDGFKNIIDALGGVEFYVPGDMNYDDPDQNLHIHLKKGLQHLDGDKAEQYVRYRSGYANADMGRIEAQQQFLKELIKQKLNSDIISKIPALYSTLKEDFDTDIGFSDVVKLAKTAYSFGSSELNTYKLPAYPKYINGVSYVIKDEEETKKLIDTVFKNENPQEQSQQ